MGLALWPCPKCRTIAHYPLMDDPSSQPMTRRGVTLVVRRSHMPFRKLLLLMAGLLGVTAPLIGTSAAYAGTNSPQPEPVVRPATHDATDPNAAISIPPERIKAALDAYSHWLDVVAQRNEVAGLATAVVVDNKVTFEREIGYADADTQEPRTPYSASLRSQKRSPRQSQACWSTTDVSAGIPSSPMCCRSSS
jgi:hypothetical protein